MSKNPYTPTLGDKFWRMAWLPARRDDELEHDLHYAATVGKLWRAEHLLTEKKVDIASGDNFAIRWAANGGHVPMLELLLRHGGVDVNAKEGDALIRAVENRHHAAAAFLLSHGADAAHQDFKALRIAAGRNDAAMMAHLLASTKNAQPLVRALVASAQKENSAIDAACLRLYQNYLMDTPPPAAAQKPPRPPQA